jgi:hypothetical protein
VDDVVFTASERERKVCPNAYRQTDPAPARDRDGRSQCDHVSSGAVLKSTPPGEQVGGTIRRGEHADLVSEVAKRPSRARDVLVDVVRLRPGERRDEADPERHGLRV